MRRNHLRYHKLPPPPKTMLQYACVQHHPNTNNIGQGGEGDTIIVSVPFMTDLTSTNDSKILNPFCQHL